MSEMQRLTTVRPKAPKEAQDFLIHRAGERQRQADDKLAGNSEVSKKALFRDLKADISESLDGELGKWVVAVRQESWFEVSDALVS
jgi:hypothetical protein